MLSGLENHILLKRTRAMKKKNKILELLKTTDMANAVPVIKEAKRTEKYRQDKKRRPINIIQNGV